MADIVTRLSNPPFGTETSERNLTMTAANEIKQLRTVLTELLADIDDVTDGKLPEISTATLTRARQAITKS